MQLLTRDLPASEALVCGALEVAILLSSACRGWRFREAEAELAYRQVQQLLLWAVLALPQGQPSWHRLCRSLLSQQAGFHFMVWPFLIRPMVMRTSAKDTESLS